MEDAPMPDDREALGVQVQWVIPDNLPTSFVNNATLSFDGAQFFLTLYQVVPPLDEARLAEIRDSKRIKAHAVARFVIPKERMPDIARMVFDFTQQSIPRQQEGENSDGSST